MANFNTIIPQSPKPSGLGDFFCLICIYGGGQGCDQQILEHRQKGTKYKHILSTYPVSYRIVIVIKQALTNREDKQQ